MSDLNNIPKHWVVKRLGEVCEIVSGNTPKGLENTTNKGDSHFYKVSDMNLPGNEIYMVNSNLKLTDEEIRDLKIKTYPHGTIIFPKRGGAILTNKKRILSKVSSFDLNLMGILPNEIVISRFLYYWFQKLDLSKICDGSNVPQINNKNIAPLEIPIPPLPEQQHIVARIEELLSELDNGRQQLLTARQQLKVYRQSLLKAAFEGRLTHKEVKEGELPVGWKWVKLKEIASDITDGDHQAPPKSSTGIPFITISNVNKTNNKIDFDDTFTVSADYYKGLKANRKPRIGDVLYTVTGSFGIPVLIDFHLEFCFQRHIGLVRPLNEINQKWVFYILQSPTVFNQAKATATGTAQKTVALNSLRNFSIPYCSRNEQDQIVALLDSKLTVCDKLEETLNTALAQSDTLRQSILKKAFEGQLV